MKLHLDCNRLFIPVVLDCERRILPVGFALAETETPAVASWLLQQLEVMEPEWKTHHPAVTLLADYAFGGKWLKAHPRFTWIMCHWHMLENLRHRLHGANAEELLTFILSSLVHASTEEQYNEAWAEFQTNTSIHGSAEVFGYFTDTWHGTRYAFF
jgi:hypothetical protein